MENWADFDPTFKRHHRRLLQLLREQSYQEGAATLSAGATSPFYINCKRTVLTAEGHFLAGWLIYRLLYQRAPSIKAVGGLVLGAAPLASAVATLSWRHNLFRAYTTRKPINAFYVRKEPKTHGTEQWIEGDVSPGTAVAILEDVITTGASTLLAVERADKHGLDVQIIIALVDREEQDGRHNVEERSGVPVFAFFRQSDFRPAEK